MRIATSILVTSTVVTFIALSSAVLPAQTPSEKKEAPRETPAFSLQRPGAAPLPLSHYHGKVIALTFISEFCSHCQALTGELNPLAKEFEPRGVQFLECAINDGAADGIKEFTTKFQPAFPVGWCTREAMLSFTGVSPKAPMANFVPRMVFLDQAGKLRDDFEPGSDFYMNAPVNIRTELEKLLKK